GRAAREARDLRVDLELLERLGQRLDDAVVGGRAHLVRSALDERVLARQEVDRVALEHRLHAARQRRARRGRRHAARAVVRRRRDRGHRRRRGVLGGAADGRDDLGRRGPGGGLVPAAPGASAAWGGVLLVVEERRGLERLVAREPALGLLDLGGLRGALRLRAARLARASGGRRVGAVVARDALGEREAVGVHLLRTVVAGEHVVQAAQAARDAVHRRRGDDEQTEEPEQQEDRDGEPGREPRRHRGRGEVADDAARVLHRL